MTVYLDSFLVLYTYLDMFGLFWFENLPSFVGTLQFVQIQF